MFRQNVPSSSLFLLSLFHIRLRVVVGGWLTAGSGGRLSLGCYLEGRYEGSDKGADA